MPKMPIKNLLLIILIFSNNIYALYLKKEISVKNPNDSIIKYKNIDPRKALEFGFNSLKRSSNTTKITLDFVNTNYYLGETFYYLGDYRNSYQYLKKSLELYELLDLKERRNRKVSKPPWILIIMGNVYFYKNDFDSAKKYYDEALVNFKLFDSKYEIEKIYGINTSESNLGLIEIRKGNFENAKKLYDKVLERRLIYGESSRISFSYLSFINLHIRNDKIKLGVEYYKKLDSLLNINQSNKFNSEIKVNFANANFEIGKYYKNQLKFQESYEYLNKSKELFKNLPHEIPKVNFEISDLLFLDNRFDESKKLIINTLSKNDIADNEKILNFKLLEKIYEFEDSNIELLAIKDSIIAYSEKPLEKQIQDEFNVLENLIIITDKQEEINRSAARVNTISIFFIILILSLSLVLLYLKYLVELQKQKNFRLSIEKSQIFDELNISKRELFSKINFIAQRNDHINNIREKIQRNNNNSVYIKELKNEMKVLTDSNKSYLEFDKMFSEVYPQFYKKLNLIAKLSRTDIRLASYIKMNHTNYEIAKISGISPRTVESQRYRLSKKLNLIGTNKDLNSYIFSI